MKKFLSLLLTVAMLLSLTPTVIFAAETDAAPQEVKLYDVHITGNVVYGGTLTANFSPSLDDADIANLCPGLDVEKTKASIEWYYKTRYGSRSSGTKSLGNNGNLTYTVPSTLATINNNPAIFFKITPKNDDGEAIGDTVYSTISYMPQSIDESITAPKAYNAHISPLNGDGIIDVGETVAARYAFTYRKSASIGEMNSRYTWYTSDDLLVSDSDIEANATKVQDESIDATYTIKPADAGKYLYAKVVAVASDGAESTAVYTKNHLGNAFLPNANSLTGHSVSTGNNSHGGFNDQSGYPAIKLVADGCAPISNSHSPSTFVQANNQNINTERTLVIDAGDDVSFDGIYLAHGYATIGKLIISYSTDNTNWTDLVVNSSCVLTSPGEHEFLADEVLSARYFKVLAKNSNNATLNIDEFYPFIKNDAWVGEYTNPVFAALTDNVIEVQAWGTPLAELHKKSNGFTLTSDYDAEETTTNADEIIANNISYVSKSVTSDGDVYTAIENPENVYVTENTENTYMKITGVNGVSQYVEIEYAGHMASNETNSAGEEITGTGNSTSSNDDIGNHPFNYGVQFEHFNEDGYAVGKYLFKAQLYAPANEKITFAIKQGGVAQTKATINNILFFQGISLEQTVNSTTYARNDIGIPGMKLDTGYNYKLGKWYDIEVLLDYDSLNFVDKKINISIWIDGILIGKELEFPWTDPGTLTSGAGKNQISPFFSTYPAKNGVKHRYSSVRKVWSADTHVVENDYDLKIVNSDAADVEATTPLTAGSYTANTNMNVYKGSNLVTYIAKYYVNGDTKELVQLASAGDYVTVTEDELTANMVELKAITMSTVNSAHYPQFVSKSLKSK